MNTTRIKKPPQLPTRRTYRRDEKGRAYLDEPRSGSFPSLLAMQSFVFVDRANQEGGGMT